MTIQHQFCTFFLNDIFFGIDVQQVEEIIRALELTRVPLASPDVCGLINLRGQIVTVIDLRQRLEMVQEEEDNTKAQRHKDMEIEDEQVRYNVVVRADAEVVSLQVDDIGDILTVSEDDFEFPPATLKGKMRHLLQGAYKLPEGFLLVLDPKKVLEVKGSRE